MMFLPRNVSLLAGVSLGLSVLFACSTKNEAAVPTACDESLCAKNNKCINNGKTTECRLTCAKQADCPANFQCTTNVSGTANFCAKLEGYAASITPKDKGQWGYSCKASGGLEANPDCDNEQGFWCYGENPSDAEAFCTQYQCTTDAECKGGYYCATINAAPDVRTPKRSVGQTTTACLPRTYCSLCKTDIDCPSISGTAQHCVAGTDNVMFCSPECANNGNCRLDATCSSYGDFNACMPRAGLCKGDGSFCAPCYADTDCVNGVCVTASYSREKYCATKSATPCAVVNNKLVADCPTKVPAGVDVTCETTRGNQSVPKDYCYGLITFGGSPADACWTRERKK